MLRHRILHGRTIELTHFDLQLKGEFKMNPALTSFALLLVLFLAPFTPVSASEPKAALPPAPKKNLPLPGEVFLISEHTAFLIPGKVDPGAKSKSWVWYAPTLPGLPGKEEQ
jgi:hypothetical protein